VSGLNAFPSKRNQLLDGFAVFVEVRVAGESLLDAVFGLPRSCDCYRESLATTRSVMRPGFV
jgi:hypothetical protein